MTGLRFLCWMGLLGCFCILMSCETESSYASPRLSVQSLDLNQNTTSEYIVVIGDVQEYTANMDYMPYYAATVEWIYSQYLNGIDIKCVLQVGDITSNNQEHQYQSFYNATISLAEFLPYVACIGNHDYEWDENLKIQDRDQTYFSQYASFERTEPLIVDRFEAGRMENVIVQNYIGGESYYMLVLEFGPREEVIEWANRYVSSHKDLKFILMTHEYLKNDGARIVSDSYAELQFRNTTYSTPEDIWQNLVKSNNNIAWVICGHNGFYAHVFSENDFGRSVPQLLFNLQYQENGGNGLVELWEFPENQDSAIARIYNTVERQWYMQDGEIVELKFKYKY